MATILMGQGGGGGERGGRREEEEEGEEEEKERGGVEGKIGGKCGPCWKPTWCLE